MMPDDFPFIQHLKRVWDTRLLVTYEPHLSERSHAQNTEFDEILKVNGTVEFGRHGGHRLPEPGNMPNDTFDRTLRQNTTGCLLLRSNRLLADRPDIRLNQLIPKIIPRTQIADHSIFVRDRNLPLADNVEILFCGLALLGEYLPLVERHLGDEIRQSGHLVRLELRVGEDGHSHQHALFHCMIDQILQWTESLLKRLPRKTKGDAGNFGGNVGQTRVAGEKGTLPKEIPRPKDLIDILTVPKPDIMHFHTAFL
mmetsp:Transcript_38550/g.69504  ORF Transcript_38550/g.69504 Transcript_38550/m.69504 type:complete len:254 (-) Transcript_38550:45-806(-)